MECGLSCPPVGDASSYNFILGANTTGAAYQFTEEDAMTEIAAAIKTWGSNIFKCVLGPNVLDKNGICTNDCPSNMTELCQVRELANVLGEPSFKWYLFWFQTYNCPTHPKMLKGDWTEEHIEREYQETKDWALYMLRTYAGTGKVFMAGNWEGDWPLLNISGHGKDQSKTVKDEIIQRAIACYGARQRAIEDARREAGSTDVHVLFYIEMNHGCNALAGKPGITNSVLPVVNPDLVSFSSYDCTNALKARNAEELKKATDKFGMLLEHVASKLQPKDMGIDFAARVMIGEYGIQKKAFRNEALRLEHAKRVMIKAVEFGCAFVMYWAYHGNTPEAEMWLVDPDGRQNDLWHMHSQYFAAAKEFVVASEAKNGRVPSQEEFRAWALDFLRQYTVAGGEAGAAAAEEERGFTVKCAGCDFVVTGVTPTHCCAACKNNPSSGRHGPRCKKQVYCAPVRGAPQGEAPARRPVPGVTKCVNCDFAVTGITPRHCCKKCQQTPGNHGPRCEKKAAFDFEPPPRNAAPQGAPQEGWTLLPLETEAADHGADSEEDAVGAGDDEEGDDDTGTVVAEAPTEDECGAPETPYSAWLEDVALQIGNATFELNWALKLWWCAAFRAKRATPPQKKFELALKASGQLQSQMRRVVTMARNSPQLSVKLGRFLPNAQSTLDGLRKELAALGKANHRIMAEEYAATAERLLARIDAYFKAICAGAGAAGGDAPYGGNLPPPAERTDFAQWGDAEQNLWQSAESTLSAGGHVSETQILAVARLVGNSAHELQNLTIVPRGAVKKPACQHVLEMAKLAVKIKAWAFVIVVATRSYQRTQRLACISTVADKGKDIETQVTACEEHLQKAKDAEGADRIPLGAIETELTRLGELANALQPANLPFDGAMRPAPRARMGGGGRGGFGGGLGAARMGLRAAHLGQRASGAGCSLS